MTAAATAAPAGSGMRRTGKIMSIIGGIILALSLIVGIILAVSGFGKVSSAMKDVTVFSGQTTVTVSADTAVQLYAKEGETAPRCTVTDPQKAEVAMATNQSSEISKDGTKWKSFDGFTANKAGAYTVSCDGDTEVMVGPPVSIGGILGGLGGILLGVLGGGLGLLLLVVGLILYFVGRSKAKAAAHA